jgi:hypothetical protein
MKCKNEEEIEYENENKIPDVKIRDKKFQELPKHILDQGILGL